MKRFIILLIILSIGPLGYSEVIFDPWLNGFGYRRPISLSPATPQANYQVKVTLTTGVMDNPYSNINANGSDIRFTGSDGTTLQDYWIESWDNTGTSTIWVEVKTSGESIIYMYYGNSSASSTSDISATFIRIVDGVKGSWHLDENSGYTAQDTSGNGNNGTLESATWTSGKYGSAVYFNGSSYRIKVLDSSSLRITGSVTVEAWVYNQHTGTSVKPIVAKYKSNTNQRGYQLDINAIGGTEPAYDYWVSNDGSTRDHVTFSSGEAGGPYPNQWKHVVGVYNQSLTTLTLYVNGNIVSGPKSTSIGNVYATPVDFYIGSNAVLSAFWLGKIDEVRVYNRALTSPEISDIFNNYGYTTPNYPGKVLVRKYTSPETLAGSPGSEDSLVTQAGSATDWSWKVPSQGEKVRSGSATDWSWVTFQDDGTGLTVPKGSATDWEWGP